MPSLPERRPPRLRVRRLLRRRLLRLWNITLAARRRLLSRISRVLQKPPLVRVRRRRRVPGPTLRCCRLRSQRLRRVRRQCPRLPRVRGLLHLRMAHPRALRRHPRIRRRRLLHRLMDRQDRLTGRLLRRPMRRPRRRVLHLGRLRMARPPGLAKSLSMVARPPRVLLRHRPGRRLRS